MVTTIEIKKRRTGFLFSLPALAFFLVFFLYPIITCLWTSLTKWDLVHPRVFVGLKNYIDLFGDRNFRYALFVTLYFTIVTSLLSIILSFILALVIDTEMMFAGLFKIIYFIPAVLSLSVIAILFRYMYNPYGLITLIGEKVLGVTLEWTASYELAMPSVILMVTWNRVGFYIVIFLAGLKAIPTGLYDSAKIDGANHWNIVWRIIIPLMNPIFLLNSILLITENFRQFVPFYLLTDGGPGRATTVLTLKIYRDGLESLRMGVASAESIFAVLIMLAFTVVYLRLFGRETEY
jgi:multiple sugar transport system permease protein